MKKLILAAGLFVAACGQSTTPSSTAATPAAPEGLMERTLAQSAEMRPVAATTALMAYHAAHPEVTPRCTEIREAAAQGTIATDVPDTSVFKPFVGDLVFTVQCGPRLTTVPPDPRQHWIVAMAPGAADATIVTCADAHGNDACIASMPRRPGTPH